MVEQEISERGKRSYMLLAKDGILLSNEELEEICGLDLKMPQEAYVTDKNIMFSDKRWKKQTAASFLCQNTMESWI